MSSVWRPNVPFNDLPQLPPSNDLETKSVLKACIPARAALAELKQAAELIPNQAMLINTLPLLEARASSEIENIFTTNDLLFRFRQDEEHADSATKEALRYSHALLDGFQSNARRPLTASTTERVCSTIKGVEMRVRTNIGTVIAGPRGVVYTPPEGERLLRDLLANWERFLHEHQDIDPLIRMAAGHYQFEAIHPFTDGNGRTGRILNILFLIQENLLSLPILYLSRYIIDRKRDYYGLLNAVTSQQAWEEWLVFMLRGVEETALWTTAKIEAIRTAFDAAVQKVRADRPKIYTHELVRVVFEQPYCRIQNIIDAGLAKRQTASRYLAELAEIGILRETIAGREKLFLNIELMRLLTQEHA